MKNQKKVFIPMQVIECAFFVLVAGGLVFGYSILMALLG